MHLVCSQSVLVLKGAAQTCSLHRLADVISWIEEPSMLASQALMSSRDISLILATGGPQMVRGQTLAGALQCRALLLGHLPGVAAMPLF